MADEARRPSRAMIVVVVLLSVLAGCSGTPTQPEKEPWPDGITVHIDQSRIKREGRELYLRVANDTKSTLTIERFRLTSPRFDDVVWRGEEPIGAAFEADLEFTMPRGRCGAELDARVEFTYRVGDEGARRSTTAAADPYGNATEFTDRDCTEDTLREAADLSIDQPVVTGAGRSAVLVVPITMTPTGRRSDVRFAGFGNTPLFRQAAGSPTDVDVRLRPNDPATTVTMQVVPARCDPHALAEDKVGRLFPVKVVADDVGADATFFLPLTEAQREAFYAYFRIRCGLD